LSLILSLSLTVIIRLLIDALELMQRLYRLGTGCESLLRRQLGIEEVHPEDGLVVRVLRILDCFAGDR